MPVKNTRGFTIVELLVVIAVLGLIASIILVATKDSRERAEITATFQHAASVHHLLGSDLAGEWKFDDGLNRGKDTSGDGNNLTIVQLASFVPSFLSQAGDAFKCIDFLCQLSGSTPSSTSLNLGGGDITIVAWIRRDSDILTSLNIFYYGLLLDLFSKYNFARESNSKISMKIGLNSAVSSEKVLILNKWHFVAGTYNNTTKWLTIYINGNQDKTQQMSALPDDWKKSSESAWAGTGAQGATVDEIRVYRRALTSFQIQQLYAEGLERHRELAEK